VGEQTAARALLPAALVVLLAGVVAASAAQVDEAVAATAPAPASMIVRPAFTSDAVPIDLAATTTTTVVVPPPTTAPPTSLAPTTTSPPPPTTSAPPPTTAPPPPPPPPATTTTTTAPAPAPAPAPASDVDLACERDLFDRTNEVRVANGLAPLAFDSRPHAVARNWSRRMAAEDRLYHNPRYGAELDAQGVPWRIIGENVGRGDAARIFELWMASATHRRNILEPAFTAFAVACVVDGSQVYVTQDFYG